MWSSNSWKDWSTSMNVNTAKSIYIYAQGAPHRRAAIGPLEYLSMIDGYMVWLRVHMRGEEMHHLHVGGRVQSMINGYMYRFVLSSVHAYQRRSPIRLVFRSEKKPYFPEFRHTKMVQITAAQKWESICVLGCFSLEEAIQWVRLN